jgi:Bacterial Ig-like domain
MILSIKSQSIPFFVFIAILGTCAASASLSELKPYLKKSLSWKCTTLNKDIPLNIYYSGDNTDSDGADVVLYLKNKAWERIGQEPDLSILSDLIQKKFIVMTADFGNDRKAVSPYIDNDINEIYSAVFGYKTTSLLNDINLVPRIYRCFVIPEGYRVATNLTFWEFDKHGVYGTLEYIMKTYNAEIVPKVPGKKPALTPGDMVDRKGNPFDYRIKMDILYPSQPKKKLPTFVYSDTSQYRNAHCEPSSDGSHLNWFQLRGYVNVVMGHCFNPCVTHYWHFIDFTLDHWNGLACYTAALRYIYMNATKYSINTDHIGVMGISKGQYAVTRLSDPHNAGGIESKIYEGFPEGTPESQPWPGYASKISVGWQGMGMGLWEYEYITPDYVPTIIACGEHDRDVITKEGYPRFLKRLEELDINHVSLFMEVLGHSLAYGYDKRMGVDRYQLVIDFFDRYLKVEDKLPPVVLVVNPRDSAENVSPSSSLSVQFAPVIDENTILQNKAVTVIRAKDNQELTGTWKVSHGGTKFTFTPGQPLEKSEVYNIHVSSKVKDKAGIQLKNEKHTHFKVAEE